MFFLLILLGCLAAIVSAPVRFIMFLNKGFKKPIPKKSSYSFLGITSDLSCLFGLPLAYLLINQVEFVEGNHWFWGAWVATSITAYFVAYAAKVFPFLQEFGLNLLLGASIAVNLYVGYDLTYQVSDGFWFSVVGNGPIILIFLIALMRRYVLFARRLPSANDALRHAHANVLDYMPAEPDDLLQFNSLNPVEDAAVRVLASPLYLRLGVFIVGGFLVVSSGLLLGNLLGYAWF